MKKNYFILLFLLTAQFFFSQDGFQFRTNKKKITVPFELGNNLIIIPVELNGISLNFLLDTGVENTILFSLEEADSIRFDSVQKIKIKGLGAGKSIDALHSKNNKLSIKEFVDDSHEVFIILDQDVNFSSQLGIPVHGIIGYHFFKKHFIEINYHSKKIFIYKEKKNFPSSKLNTYDCIPISIELEKPYVKAIVNLEGKDVETKLLIDTGGTDAIWLFENNKEIKSPSNYFNDFLGRGFSGDINGKRSRVNKIKLGNNDIQNPTISYPDETSFKDVILVKGRNGSIGSGIFKRFNVIFDYEEKKIYLKPNQDFEEPFNYNMSGIEVQHSGLQWIKEEVELKTSFVETKNVISVIDNAPKTIKYQFALKPIYEVISVRPSSPADKAGVKKGDVIQSINGKYSFKYKLQDIISLMQSEEGKTIKLELERKGIIIKTKFDLKKIL